MSTHDMNIANQGFPAFRSDLNNALAALASNSLSATAPSTTFAGQTWFDTTANLLKLRNKDNDAWVTLAYVDPTSDEWELRSAVIQAVDSAGISLKTDDGTTRLEIQDDGDVSIDSGTLFVDATNNRVGVGTSSPATQLHIQNSSGNSESILGQYGTGTRALIGAYNNQVELRAYNGTNDVLTFKTGSLEAMRIDSSGNLMVGTTDTDPANNGAGGGSGFSFSPNGFMNVARSNNACIYANRMDGDGDIVQFRKNGSTVGSIGNVGSNVAFNALGGNYGLLQVNGNTRYVWYETSFYPEQDNLRDLGLSPNRWDDIYATNGTIQTSDRKEKQDIASLSDAEMRVAKRISAMFKKFRWIDSVEAKGDDARIHNGVIAQDVQQAFADESLDAGDYALFISTTWWETQTEVPAVEAVAEVLDEEGNVVTEAVEGREAYTRTDTYDSADEAPEGATERTRMGIRYPQLLSFLAAYNEQRFAAIEARLDALEA